MIRGPSWSRMLALAVGIAYAGSVIAARCTEPPIISREFSQHAFLADEADTAVDRAETSLASFTRAMRPFRFEFEDANFGATDSTAVDHQPTPLKEAYRPNDQLSAGPIAESDTPQTHLADDPSPTGRAANCGCRDHLYCPDDEPWRVFENGFTCRHQVIVDGWYNGGYTLNPDRPSDRFNGPVTFNDRSNEGQFNQLYLTIQRSVDTAECAPQLGGRADLLYGTDSRFTKALGLELHQDGNDRWNSARFMQLSLPQLYGEVGWNEWCVRVGRFYTLVGYEVVPAPENFFYSHAYHFQYGEPFTHTGLLVTKDLSEHFSISGGLHRGWDQWEDANDRWSFLGGLTIADSDAVNKLSLGFTTGDELAPLIGISDNRSLVSLVYTLGASRRLTYIVQSDYGVQQSGVQAGPASFDSAQWYGVNQYVLYQLTCKWSAGARVEWFRDDDGTRVSSINSGGAASGNFAASGPFAGDFKALTLGLNYKPTANIIVRPELRWDHFAGSPGGLLPFDTGTDNTQFLLGIDATLRF